MNCIETLKNLYDYESTSRCPELKRLLDIHAKSLNSNAQRIATLVPEIKEIAQDFYIERLCEITDELSNTSSRLTASK